MGYYSETSGRSINTSSNEYVVARAQNCFEGPGNDLREVLKSSELIENLYAQIEILINTGQIIHFSSGEEIYSKAMLQVVNSAWSSRAG